MVSNSAFSLLEWHSHSEFIRTMTDPQLTDPAFERVACLQSRVLCCLLTTNSAFSLLEWHSHSEFVVSLEL